MGPIEVKFESFRKRFLDSTPNMPQVFGQRKIHGNQLRTRNFLDGHGGVEVPGDLGTNRRQEIKGGIIVRLEMEQCKRDRKSVV